MTSGEGLWWVLGKARAHTVTSFLLAKLVYGVSPSELKLYGVWSTDNNSAPRSTSPLFAFRLSLDRSTLDKQIALVTVIYVSPKFTGIP